MTPTALEFDLQPGERLGPFLLGSSLWSVFEYLRQQQTAFPQVTVSFDASAPALSPVLLHIRPYIDLLFSPTQQRLHTISIRHLGIEPPLFLRYNAKSLFSPDTPLRRVDVSKIFGPTYPGPAMRYPGISFGFEEDSTGNLLKKPSNDDRLQLVKRLTLTQQSTASPSQTPATDLDSITVCPAMVGELGLADFTVGKGVILHFHTPSPARSRPIHLHLGQTRSQDVLVELGSPLRIHHKDDNRMEIHAKHAGSSADLRGYFYNYFQHGLDFFFSEGSHKLLKIIVHSNVPGSPLFQRYSRCPWKIERSSIPSTKVPGGPITLVNKINEIIEPSSTPNRMQVDRLEDSSIALPNAKTDLVGVDGIVFEVTETGDIVSFTLF